MKYFVIICLLALNLVANAGNFDIDANKCESHINQHEMLHKIPPKLLKSISLIESGRWSEKQQKLVPWPWAVNNSGKAYYFDNKREAVKFVNSLLAQGIKNIDVGCMQINLMHHPKAFDSVHQAFEPAANVKYAASFLKNHYNNESSWPKAIAYYHSTNDVGRDYYRKVLKLWNIEKQKTNKENLNNINKKPNFYHSRPMRNPKRIHSNLQVY